MGSFETLNVMTPGFFTAMNTLIDAPEPGESGGRATSAGVPCTTPPLGCRSRSSQENFNFFSGELLGTKEIAPRWKRCTPRYRQRARGSCRAGLGEAVLQPGEEGKHGQTGGSAGSRAGWTIFKQLPWMSEATRKNAEEKLALIRKKMGIRSTGVTTRLWRSTAMICWEMWPARPCMRIAATWTSWANRLTRRSGA